MIYQKSFNKIKKVYLFIIFILLFPFYTYSYYDIQKYIATFKVKHNSPDVFVTLDIKYNIRNEFKNSGFKFVGNFDVVDLECADELGNSLSADVEYLKETKITWQFKGIENGVKRVIVSFILKNALTGDMNKNRMTADWTGVFRIPVYNAEYRFIFPSEFDYKIIKVNPGYYKIKNKQIVVEQNVLKDKGFTVVFTPGLTVNKENYIYALLKKVFKNFKQYLFYFLFFGITIFSTIISIFSKKNKGTGGEGSSCDSCSGCSSCGG